MSFFNTLLVYAPELARLVLKVSVLGEIYLSGLWLENKVHEWEEQERRWKTLGMDDYARESYLKHD